jgi:molecular chaperone HtpG
VLFLADPIDEFMVQALGEYEGHALRSAALGSLDESAEEDGEEAETSAGDLGRLLEALRTPLQDPVKEVRVSSRLTTSPACLVGGEHDISPQLERILRQTRGDEAVPPQKRILEVNADHELIRALATVAEGDVAAVEPYARSLYDYALLAEGGELPSPADFRRRLDEMMLASLTAPPGADPAAAAGEEE